jgi:hypothetical protein
LDYDDETNKVTCKSLFDHDAEVWHIAPSLKDANSIVTCHPASGAGIPDAVTLWKLKANVDATGGLEEKRSVPNTDDDLAKVLGIPSEQDVAKDFGDVADLEEVVELEASPTSGKPASHKALTRVVGLGVNKNSPVCRSVWRPDSPSFIMTVQEDSLRLWDVSKARSADMKLDESVVVGMSDGRSQFASGCFDPIHPTQFVVGEGTGVSVWDVRKKQ